MRYWWLAWWQARRYSLLASMTCRRYSSAGISNGTPRTRLGGPGMWAGHPRGQLDQGPTGPRGQVKTARGRMSEKGQNWRLNRLPAPWGNAQLTD